MRWLLGRPATTKRVLIHEDVVEASKRLIAASPRKETGGKFIGFVIGQGTQPPNSEYGSHLRQPWRELSRGGDNLLIVGSIPPGPGAHATATSLIPDGEFQARAYRQAEMVEPDIDHLGSWHSHHPNGHPDFSFGDRDHYASVIADGRHLPNYFLAGLCHDFRGLSAGVFDLYDRGAGGRYRRLTRAEVGTSGSFPSLQETVERRLKEERYVDALWRNLDIELRRRFSVRERKVESDAIAWILDCPREPEILAVVLQTLSADGHVTVSLEVRSESGTMNFDGAPSAHELLRMSATASRMAENIDKAILQASTRSVKRRWGGMDGQVGRKLT